MSVLCYALAFWILVFRLLFGVSARSTCISVASSKTIRIWYLAQHLSVSQSVSCSVKVALPYFNGSHTLSNRIWRVYLWQRVALIIITTLRPQTPDYADWLTDWQTATRQKSWSWTRIRVRIEIRIQLHLQILSTVTDCLSSCLSVCVSHMTVVFIIYDCFAWFYISVLLV